MSLPTNDDIDRVLIDRPGDDLYPDIQPKVDFVDEKEKEHRAKLVDLIIKDLIEDLAIANSMDEIGGVLEYLAQKRQIAPPVFDGDPLMRAFGRISKLKLSLEYAQMIGISNADFDAIRKAEVERLWGDTNAAMLKKLLLSKSTSQTTNVVQPTETGVRMKEIPDATS